MQPDCLFCRIVAGDVPATIVHDDEEVLAFRDVNPQAPTHVLVIPKSHIASAAELKATDGALLGKLFAAIADIADREGLSRGWRVVTNVGPEAGQSVHHLHLHLLGGRGLHWPPG